MKYGFKEMEWSQVQMFATYPNGDFSLSKIKISI